MGVKTGIFIVICLLFLIGTTTALIPDASTVTLSNSWVVANGVDWTTITVTALNESAPVPNAIVQFSVDNPIYGSFSPLTNTTNSIGEAQSTFRVNITSGAVNITVRITADGHSVFRNVTVNIDHDTPYYPYFNHPLSGTVGMEVPFNISVTDYWGNRIDNRRGDHVISLHVHGPAPDDCNFVGSGQDISRALDPNGNLSVKVKLTSKIGPNTILMDTIGSIPDKLEWIDADNTGIPFSMDQGFSPSGSPPAIPADGESYFTIVYTLYDKYGNPTNGQSVWVNTSIPGEESQFQSNNLGQVTVQYGPRSSIGVIQITVTSVVNNTVTLSQTVEFTHTGAKIIKLTANPDSMASNDVPPSTAVSNIIATVADQSGNAVPGESVNFTLDSITYDGIYNVTAEPILLSSSDITDGYGQAVVQFKPGAFTTLGNSGFNASATGRCNVIATWNGTQKIVPVTWKNYPYLSISTSVSPLTVGINQTIDITIGFKGDGWAMQATPIDVDLIIDRSSSMISPDPTRISSAKTAAKKFVGIMSKGDNGVGLISFAIGTTLNKPLTLNDFNGVNSSIDSLNTNEAGTDMRMGLYRAVNDINDKGRAGSIKAVILMTDGDFNFNGSILGHGTGWPSDNPDGNSVLFPSTNLVVPNDYRYIPGLGGTLTPYSSCSAYSSTVCDVCAPGYTAGTGGNIGKCCRSGTCYTPQQRSSSCSERHCDTLVTRYKCTDGETTTQNMSIYAHTHGVRLYAIGFAGTINPVVETALTAMTENTGGYYQYAPDAAALNALYEQIADELTDTAGVNVTSTIDFQNINVTGATIPGNQVYDYVYHPTYSTKINWQNGTTTVPAIDQSSDWAADNKLDFTIGTIKVGQQWNATFRLKVKQSGIFDVFGDNSIVTFNEGVESLIIPQTFITVIPQLNITEIKAKKIALDNLIITEPGEITTFLPVMWNTSYTGNKTITEKVYYSIDNGQWVQFTVLTHNYPYAPDIIAATEYVDNAQLDTRNLPPGGYKIKVYATSPDTADATVETDYKAVGGRGRVFIKLEAPPFEYFGQQKGSNLTLQYTIKKVQFPFRIFVSM